MKKIFPRLPKKVLVAAAAVLIGITGLTVAAMAWGPNRPTFTMQNPAPYVTFDSITNNPNYGNELTFFDGKNNTDTTSGGFSNPITVTPGETVLLRVYVHNDAASNLNGANLDGPGVAHNVTARIYLPTAIATALAANAYIDASNANPTEVYDTVDLNSSTPFSLQYVPGSAVMYTNAVPSGFALNDNIVSGGAPIGYTGPDGTIPGCLQYSGIITIEAKVVAPAFTLTKNVANIGDSSWSKSVTTQPGATVSYELAFANTGSAQLQNVVLRDQLPSGLSMVHDSSTLYDGSNPNGINLGTDAVDSSTGVNIGTYDPTAGAYLVFKATVADASQLQCGENTIVNTGESWVGSESATDTATITVNNNCQQQTPTYSCDELNVTPGDHTVTISDFQQSASNGATFDYVVIDWGQNSQSLMTTNPVGQTYTYNGNGPFTITATAYFNVPNQSAPVSATSTGCIQLVSFTTTPTTPTTPLVNTGPGNDILGIVGVATVVGFIAHNLFIRRFASKLN